MEPSRDQLLAEALSRPWYHTIDLGDGSATPGSVDLRRHAPRLLPADLSGLRALDVGTFDGFWAFELERRGAETVAIDLDRFDATDWPPLNRERLAAAAGDSGPGERFQLAARLLDSSVRRIDCSVYELEPGRIGGPVGYAVIGDLLIHLRDPVRGLERIREALEPGGRLLVVDQLNLFLTLLRPRRAAAAFKALATDYNWWEANLRCFHDWLLLAGFEPPHSRRFFKLDAPRGQAVWHVALEARRPESEAEPSG